MFNIQWIPLISIKQIMFWLFMFVCQQSDQVLFAGTLWYSSATPNPKHPNILQKNLFSSSQSTQKNIGTKKKKNIRFKLAELCAPPNRNHPTPPTSVYFVGKCRKNTTSPPKKKNCSPWLWPPGENWDALAQHFDLAGQSDSMCHFLWNSQEFQNISYLEDPSSYPLGN